MFVAFCYTVSDLSGGVGYGVYRSPDQPQNAGFCPPLAPNSAGWFHIEKEKPETDESPLHLPLKSPNSGGLPDNSPQNWGARAGWFHTRVEK
jgi:hypothetical protein